MIILLKGWRKKFRPVFKELQNFLPKKLSLSSQNYGFGIRYPRSGIRKKPIPDPRSWIQGSKRHRIPDPGSGPTTLLLATIYARKSTNVVASHQFQKMASKYERKTCLFFIFLCELSTIFWQVVHHHWFLALTLGCSVHFSFHSKRGNVSKNQFA